MIGDRWDKMKKRNIVLKTFIKKVWVTEGKRKKMNEDLEEINPKGGRRLLRE